VLYLGSDLPVDDWVATARTSRARAAVIGVLTAADVRPAVEVATALRSAGTDLAILFGGRSAARAGVAFEMRSARPAHGAVEGEAVATDPGTPPLVLPEPLVDAVRALEQTIGRPA
jgi:hypothetical protein